jgi:hypothetical protein
MNERIGWFLVVYCGIIHRIQSNPKIPTFIGGGGVKEILVLSFILRMMESFCLLFGIE